MGKEALSGARREGCAGIGATTEGRRPTNHIFPPQGFGDHLVRGGGGGPSRLEPCQGRRLSDLRHRSSNETGQVLPLGVQLNSACLDRSVASSNTLTPRLAALPRTALRLPPPPRRRFTLISLTARDHGGALRQRAPRPASASGTGIKGPIPQRKMLALAKEALPVAVEIRRAESGSETQA